MKNGFKRLLLIIAFFLALIFITLMTIAVTFFYDPTIFINPKNLNYALTKTKVLDQWSWKSAEINHQWIAWNKRRFYGGFQDLCLVYNNADVGIDTCLDKISWNVELSWNKSEGFKYGIYESLIVESSKLQVTPKENKEESPPPDLLSYWDMLWSPLTPDFNLLFKKIEILKKDSPLTFDLKMTKNPKMIVGEALGFHLEATKNKINIHAPKKILMPFDLKTKNPLYFSEIKIEARILGAHIPVAATAKVETAELKLETQILKSALKEDFRKPKFLKQVLQKTSGTLQITKLKSTIENLVRPPFNILPAPINAMEGTLRIGISTDNYKEADSILVKIKTELDMSGASQNLKLAVNSEVPVKLKGFAIGPVTLGLDLKEVKLLLPRLSRTRLPPQLVPDSRFKNSTVVIKEYLNEENIPPTVKKKASKANKEKVDINMQLQALGENALHMNTNLLDETLRLNFDLNIVNGEIQKGFVQTLPITTTIFKRKIRFTSVRVIFATPLEPQIIATIEFLLPEYKVKLQLEGPMSNPRQAFSSEPPLPLDDIYAVILFGRPLSGLDSDDRSAAKKSNQILSQGILSLAVLYYFAGSPVESLGYNPESNEVSAQIGLGAKNSLRVGGTGEGLNSAGVRRSLGKGWYIDSSVQKTTKDNGSSTGDFGVLLERVISY